MPLYLLPHFFEGLVRLCDKATHLVETNGVDRVRRIIDCEGYFYPLCPQPCPQDLHRNQNTNFTNSALKSKEAWPFFQLKSVSPLFSVP